MPGTGTLLPPQTSAAITLMIIKESDWNVHVMCTIKIEKMGHEF